MMSDRDYESSYRSYMNALLEGDVRVGQRLIKELLLHKVPLSRIFSDYIQRGMYEVGALWESNQVSVSTEHLAASTAQLLISDLYLQAECRPRNGKRVVISCVSREFHDVGALILSNVFHSTGWDVSLLGANVPTGDLVDFIEKYNPAVLALSVTLPANREALEQVLETVVPTFPQLDVFVGGQAIGGSHEADQYRATLAQRFPSLRYLQTLDELEHHLLQHY